MTQKDQVIVEVKVDSQSASKNLASVQKELKSLIESGKLGVKQASQLASAYAHVAKATAEMAKATAKAIPYEQRLALAQEKTRQTVNRLAAEKVKLERQTLANAKATQQHANSYNSLSGQMAFTVRQMFGVYAITQSISRIFTTGFDFNKFIQSSTAAFGVMMKSTDAAKAKMEELYNFAVDSPLTFRETVSASKQLMAYGFAANELVPTMKTLGTVAKATGHSLDDISYVYGTLRTQGRAYTRDLMQFAMRGIPIYEELAKVMGVQREEIQKMTEEGKVGFKEIEQAFVNMTTGTGRFAGFFSEYLKTMEGQLSILTDVGEKAAGDLTKGVFDALIPIIRDLTETLRENSDVWKDIGTNIGGVIGLLAGAGKVISIILSPITSLANLNLGYMADFLEDMKKLGSLGETNVANRNYMSTGYDFTKTVDENVNKMRVFEKEISSIYKRLSELQQMPQTSSVRAEMTALRSTIDNLKKSYEDLQRTLEGKNRYQQATGKTGLDTRFDLQARFFAEAAGQVESRYKDSMGQALGTRAANDIIEGFENEIKKQRDIYGPAFTDEMEKSIRGEQMDKAVELLAKAFSVEGLFEDTGFDEALQAWLVRTKEALEEAKKAKDDYTDTFYGGYDPFMDYLTNAYANILTMYDNMEKSAGNIKDDMNDVLAILIKMGNEEFAKFLSGDTAFFDEVRAKAGFAYKQGNIASGMSNQALAGLEGTELGTLLSNNEGSFTKAMADSTNQTVLFTNALVESIKGLDGWAGELVNVVLNPYQSAIKWGLSFVSGALNQLGKAIFGSKDIFGSEEEQQKFLVNLDKLSSAVGKVADQIERDIGSTISDIKDALSSQIDSLRDLYEVGAISGAQFAQQSKAVWEQGQQALIDAGMAQVDATKALGNEITGGKSLADLYTQLTAQLGNQQQVKAIQAEIARLKTIGEAGTDKAGFEAAKTRIQSMIGNLPADMQAELISAMDAAGFNVAGGIKDRVGKAMAGLSGADKVKFTQIMASIASAVNSGRMTDEQATQGMDRALTSFGYAVGTPSVPNDMMANVHKGEIIVPSTFSDAIRSGELSLSGTRQNNNSNIQVIVNVQGSVTAENDLATTIAEKIYLQKSRGYLTIRT